MLLGAPHLHEHWSRIRGLRMHARVSTYLPANGRPAIVLVHGLAVSSRYLMPLAQALAPVWPVYAPDLPGFGRSATPRRALPIPELATFLRSWITHLLLGDIILVGNSMGCQIITEYLRRWPRDVRGCVMLGPTMDAYARTTPRQVWRLFLDQFREPASLAPLQAIEYIRFGAVRTMRTFWNALEHRIEQQLASVPIPTLVMRGARDPIVSQKWAETVARLLPRGELVVAPGAGHALNYNSPRLVANAIERFFSHHLRLAA